MIYIDTKARERLYALVDADEATPLADVVEKLQDRLAHAEDVQNGDDAASRVAERVMREVRKEFEDLMEAQEAEHRRQMANKEKRHAEEKQHLRDQLHDALAENERLRAAAEEVLSWPTRDMAMLLSNPPQNAALFRAQSVLRKALEKKP